MKEVTNDEVTNQAQTYDPLNAVCANNESKQTRNILLVINNLLTSLTCSFNSLAQEEFDYLYSTVNKKKKASNQPNHEFTDGKCSKTTTAAGISMIKAIHTSDATISTNHA